MKTVIIVLSITWWLFFAGCYVGNVIKLIGCDWKDPYKGEIIHAIGLVPGLSLFTVWNNDK